MLGQCELGMGYGRQVCSTSRAVAKYALLRLCLECSLHTETGRTVLCPIWGVVVASARKIEFMSLHEKQLALRDVSA